ncbi:MAG: TetR/AcrR family transcriptional regulator [Pseudobacteriovorax sp.]|nr:TetR/AcrR family transcriptional regulator [Pseudobacteriovorax sp.]
MGRHRKNEHDYHHGNLRHACIREGIKILKTSTPENLSLRDIARRLKVSPGAPYRHFSNKESLLAAIAAWGFQEFAKYIASGLEEAGGDQLLFFRDMGQSFLNFARDHSVIFRLMFSGIIPDRSKYPELESAGDQAFTVLTDCIEHLKERGIFKDVETRRIAIHTLSFVYGYCSLLLNHRLKDIDISSDDSHILIDQMTEDLLSGILNRKSASFETTNES